MLTIQLVCSTQIERLLWLVRGLRRWRGPSEDFLAKSREVADLVVPQALYIADGSSGRCLPLFWCPLADNGP